MTAPAALAAPPVAAFHRDPPTSVVLQVGQAATFTSDSTPGSTLSWQIDGVDVGSAKSITHTFTDPGFHVVLLEARLNGERDFAVSVFGVSSPLYPLPAPKLMSPFPTVRLVGTLADGGARIRLLEVRGAPHVARVTVRCTGRGCPFRTRRRTASTGRVRLSRWPRVLAAGTRIEVFVTARNVIGKYTSFRIRSGKGPRRIDRCLQPGSSTPSRCS